MEENLYFTYWIKRHGISSFRPLVNRVCKKILIPKQLTSKKKKEEYLFHYFWVVYYVIALKYLGIDIKQISFLVDLALAPGTCKLFPPGQIIKEQHDNIPIIVNYIKKDLELYGTIE